MKKALFLVIFSLVSFLASSQNYDQYTIYIYSFTRYIQWPESHNQGDFEILVLGDSPLIEKLKAMANHKKIGDRAITVTRISEISQIKKCNMLFLPTDKSAMLNDVLRKTDALAMLIITEQAGLGSQGSCINFTTKDGKLAFELNKIAIAKQNLKASIELTRLAIMI